MVDGAMLASAVMIQPDSQRAFDARMGLSTAFFRQNKLSEAVSLLEKSQAPTSEGEQQKTELMAQLLTAQEEPAAIAMWESYASKDESNPETQYIALSGQAQIQLGADQPQEALTLYQQASLLDVEPTQKSWARLGMANSYFEFKASNASLECRHINFLLNQLRKKLICQNEPLVFSLVDLISHYHSYFNLL